MEYVAIISHVSITVLAIGVLALRLEHRLTKIETDVTWLKEAMDGFCKKGNDHGQDTDLDQA